jgi:uncharacterized membrane protein
MAAAPGRGAVWRGAAAAALLALPALAWIARMSGLGMLADAGALVFLYGPAVAINLIMAGIFGLSLRRREPVILRFARLEGAAQTPALERYCRRLTWVWTLYLALLGAVGIVIALHGDERIGAWWCSVIDYLLIGALFLGERAYRRATGRTPASLLTQARNVRRALRGPRT